MSGLNQHGNEASVFYQKNMAVSFSKIPPYAQDGGQCAGAFLKCQWGSVKKKSLPSLVMSGLYQHGNEASVFYQKTWLRAL
jgi:hypothetical protein